MAYPYRYSPGSEVLGQSASAIFNHIQHDEVADSLKRHGVDSFKADEWYPVEKLINVFKDWYAKTNITTNLVSVGVAIVKNAPLPPDVDNWSLKEKVSLVKILYEQGHRNGLPGVIEIERINDNHARYIEDTVYPDDMIYGYIYGVARRFLSKSHDFTVKYDEDNLRQDEGGDRTIIDLILKER